MTYVYTLQSLTGEHFYTGASDELRTRFRDHNAGRVPHTAKHRPWCLKSYLAFSDPDQAWAFERYLKTTSGRAFAKKRL